jgi:hypothetical protein
MRIKNGTSRRKIELPIRQFSSADIKNQRGQELSRLCPLILFRRIIGSGGASLSCPPPQYLILIIQ